MQKAGADSGSSSPTRASPRKQASFRVRSGAASRRRGGAAPRVLRASCTVSALASKFNSLSTDEPRVAVVRSAAASTRTGSTAKRRPPVAAAAVPLVDELRVCHGAVSHTIKIFEKIENNKVNVVVPKESANGHWSASPKPKVMLKPSASFISRKASELRAVTSRRSNQVRPTVAEPASKEENVPTKNKEEKSDEPPLPPPNKTPKQVPNSTFRSYLHSISKENLNGLPLEKAALPRIEETSSAVDCDFNESDIVQKSEDTSLVEEVLKELESNKLIAECKVRLDQLTVARAQPNVSFLFSNSAAQQTTQILEGATESWSSEDYDDVYSFQPVGQDNKAELDEEYDYPLPQGDQDYDDCGPVGEGIYEDTATVYESIGSCAPSYFEKNSLYGGIEALKAGLISPAYSSHSIGSRAETISCNDGRSDIEVGSETSSSDVWVDLDISEPEEKPARLIEMTPVYREKAKNRRSPSWSLKVRRQWTHSAKKRFINYSPSNSASDDNLYEPLYEMLPPRQGAAKEVPTIAPPPPPLLDENYDSDITDSSFDSDSDVKLENVTLRRDEVHLPELPPPPTGQTGGITKIAEAASKKMKDIKRTWKRGISDKLRRLSTPNPAAIYEAQQKTLQEISVAETSPPTKEPTKNKYWTFRKNSKSGQSPRFSTQKSTDSSSSIFYVSQEIEPVDRLAELINSCHRHSSGPSSSSASLESDVGPKRHSSSIIRPKTPPPPPPTESNYKRLSENRPKEMYAEIEFSSLEQHNSFSENDSQSQKTESSEEIAGNGKGTSACFEDEPLYQFYAESVLQEAQRQLNEESDSDGYEEIGEKMMMLSSRPSAMELIKPHAHTGQRSLWCEVPDVINSGVLDRLSQQQRKLQEAKFEIITSEASYIKSLNVLIMHFVLCPELQDDLVLSKTDRDILFSGIRPVKSCSEHFLSDLEKCWQDSILLTNISSIMEKHAAKNMNVYIKYCSQQIYLDRTLKHLRETNASFASVLSKLEGHPECQSLSLHSFLMLPMQRVTRLPLLFDAVLRRLSANSDEYTSCKNALMMVNKLVQDCNEEARKMERMKEMIELSRQLEFRSEMRAVPLISSSRWLVRSGEMTQLLTRDEAKLTFGRRIAKQVVNVFLFTDLLVVAKKKGDEGYHVIDYCARNMIDVVNPEEYAEGTINLPWKIHDISSKNMLILTLLQNHEKKTNEMVLSCSLESDKQRWLAAITTPQINQNNSEERVYESWDCPQVQAIHAYVAQQPDELSLEVADVVNVLRKLPDGWYQGERIRDGECGWFPENYCKEILSSHVRARNLRQRYRLLALTSEYIDVQRKAARVGGANSSKIKLTSSEKLEVH
ncbi:ephexin-1-like isoform X1 [Cloeon dipterum]|uniref:ephexin-1-like isoform X1 n=1 Tax=Cloeon dipterum TaxID=197152 RepID=UPI00321FCFDE